METSEARSSCLTIKAALLLILLPSMLEAGDPGPEKNQGHGAKLQKIYELLLLGKNQEALHLYEDFAENGVDSVKMAGYCFDAQAKYSDTKTQVRHSREIKENIEKAII